MSLNKNSLAIIFFIVCSSWALPQSTSTVQKDSLATQDLNEVVVTATRTRRQLASLPLPVTIISKEQIRSTGVTRLDEILEEQTGIILTPDATIGGGEGIQIQGIASDYILVLIDGVPVVGRSSGNLDLSRLAIGNIEQVEVVKGPSSSLFGSEALGGVINIITSKPDLRRFSGQISHRSAEFNNQNTNLSFGQKVGGIGYSVFIDRLSTDGYDLAPNSEGQTVNPFFNYTFNARVSAALSDRLELYASGRYFVQEFDVQPSTSEERDGNYHIRLDHDPSKNTNVQYELYYTNYRTDEQTVDPINMEVLVDNDFDQRLVRPEFRYNQLLSKGNTLTFGVGYNHESLDRSLFAEEITFDSQYVFAQYDAQPWRSVNIIAGARFDNHSEYNSQFSPKVSMRFRLSNSLAIKASVGRGFKAPDFRQLYLDFTNVSGGGYSVFGKEVEAAGIGRIQDQGELATLQVDPAELGEPLDAERSVGYNLALSIKRPDWSFELNAFRNDFQNLIDTRILATKTNGQNVFGYLNRDEVYTQGLEADFRVQPFHNLTISAGYQLLYAFDKAKEEAIDQGEVFARDPSTLQTVLVTREEYFGLENRSRHTANVKLFWKIPDWKTDANLRIVYRSRFGLTDTNGNDLLDELDDSFVEGYALVNFAAAKTFLKRYRLQIGLNNLLDFQGQNPLATAGSRLLVNPGIQWFTGLNIQF